MVFSKKYCPVWVYDCVVAQSVSDFILFGVDLAQPCRKFAGGLTEVFEEVSLEELVRASELVVQFLIEEKINEGIKSLGAISPRLPSQGVLSLPCHDESGYLGQAIQHNNQP